MNEIENKINISKENLENLSYYLYRIKFTVDKMDLDQLELAQLSLYGLKFLENTELRKLEKETFIAVNTKINEIKNKELNKAFWIMRGRLLDIKKCEYGCDHCSEYCKEYLDLCNYLEKE